MLLLSGDIMHKDEFSKLPLSVVEFLNYMSIIKNKSELTVLEYASDLRLFFKFLLIFRKKVDSKIDFEQIDIVASMFDEFKTDSNVIVVDPVMGDNGKLYPAFDEAFAEKMATLCAKADIIVPNMTEASFMTGMEYKEDYDEEYVKKMLLQLSKLGAKISVLTGIGFKEGTTGVMGYDKEADEFFYYSNEKLPASFHGTGDVFASTLVGAMMNGMDWKEGLKVAADYTAECIRITMNDKNGCWYGVNFEQGIPYLLKKLGK